MEFCFDFFHSTLPQQSHHGGGHPPTRRSTTRTRTSTLAGTNARFVLSRAAKRPTTKKPATKATWQRRKRAQPGLWVLVPAAWQKNNPAVLGSELALLGTSSQHCWCTGLSTQCLGTGWAPTGLILDVPRKHRCCRDALAGREQELRSGWRSSVGSGGIWPQESSGHGATLGLGPHSAQCPALGPQQPQLEPESQQ